jgi:hypothetical protein
MWDKEPVPLFAKVQKSPFVNGLQSVNKGRPSKKIQEQGINESP